MTTEQLLNLDCTKPENRKKIKTVLYRAGIIGSKEYECEDIEHVYHDMCMTYGYHTQGVKPYYEGGEFIYYISSIIRRMDKEKQIDWIGNVYGKTFQEVLEKSVIKIYADIKSYK